MRFTDEHQQLRKTVRDFVDKEINPQIDEWEREGAFPAHALFKKAGNLGLLGINKPEAYGGMGLDYSYQMCATEELGTCRAGAIPMAAVHGTSVRGPVITSPSHMTPKRSMTISKPKGAPDSEITLDGNGVVLEEQSMKLIEARMDYEAAIGFYQKSLGLLRMAARAPGK
jgi:hypothetical protein